MGEREEMKVGALSVESIVIGLACLVVIQAIIKMTYPSSSELFSGVAMALLLGVLLVSMFQSWFEEGG